MGDESSSTEVARFIRQVAKRAALRESGRDADAGAGSGLAPLTSKSPLAVLARRAELDATSLLLLRIITAGELDQRAHRALRRLAQDPTRPGIEVDAVVSVAAAAGERPQTALLALAEDGRLASRGLIDWTHATGPLLTRRLTVPTRVLAVLAGSAPAAPTDLPLHRVPVVSPSALVAVDGLVAPLERLLRRVVECPVWLVGPAGAGKRTLLAAVAGRPVYSIDAAALVARPATLTPHLWRELLLSGALLYVRVGSEVDPHPLGELVRTLDAASLPVVYGSAESPPPRLHERPVAVLTLAGGDAADRARLLRAVAPSLAAPDQLAARFRLTPGRLQRAVATAAEIAGGAPLCADHLAEAVARDVRQQVAVLGTHICDPQSWDDVVLPDETLEAVREMVARARHRHLVMQTWGFERKLAKGLGMAALFAGPPGTGKTMVAGLIARDLGLELYQMDLSRIVSKYIGETEKNLAKVFDAAEGANVLLLFDEADSLFTKRTEVKSSVDRYSNLEINYLLQRLERFEGVSILTTNLEGSIDPAFKRRLAFRVQFPVPDQAERQRLWQRLLPREAAVAGPIDFDRLAAKYELTGGNIRNAVLRGAFLAAAADGAISMDHLERAVTLEYRDAGRLSTSGRLG